MDLKQLKFCCTTASFPTNAEIPYWWCVTTQICAVLLICWSKFSMRHNQIRSITQFWIVMCYQCGILCSFLGRHFAWNVSCFLRTTDKVGNVGNVGCYEKKTHPWKLVWRNQSDPSEIECWNQNSKGNVCRRVERQALAYSPTTTIKLHFPLMACTS